MLLSAFVRFYQRLSLLYSLFSHYRHLPFYKSRVIRCTFFKDEEKSDSEDFKRNAEINNGIRMDRKILDRTVRIFLLGRLFF